VSLAELAKNKAEWPVEVALTEKVTWPVVIGGKERGTTELPPGTKVKLIEVLGETVKVSYTEAMKVIPTKATDLVGRVSSASVQRAIQQEEGTTESLEPDAPSKLAETTSQQTKLLLRIKIERKSSTSRKVEQKAGVRYYPSANLEIHSPEVVGSVQENAVHIHIQNLTGHKADGLVVRYAVFLTDTRGGTIVFSPDKYTIATSGIETVDIGPTRTVTVITKPFTAESRQVAYKHGYFQEDNSYVAQRYLLTAVKVYRGEELVARHGPDLESSDSK
jgi:hypothetical protein